jgi:hypothetical protein
VRSLSVWALVRVLFGHWVSDFVLQPSWMGKRKSKEWWVLTQHALIIMYGSWAVGWLVVACQGHWYSFFHSSWPLWFGLVNGGAHFAIDAVTSRMTSRLWQKERVHAFFTVIGFDQFLHLTVAVTTLTWLIA